MKAPDEVQAFGSKKEIDPYAQVISEIEKNPAPRISVPHLSKLLGVKTTTLNARFRRQQTSLRMVGRTSFIPLDVALDLAALHKYALLGWPTLQQAARLTGVKSGTIKARCEKGRVEGHMDLTKRLRISPSELNDLRVPIENRRSVELPLPLERSRVRQEATKPHHRRKIDRQDERSAATLARKAQTVVSPRPPDHHVHVITAEDYGLRETEHQPDGPVEKQKPQKPKQKPSGWLSYDPDRPFTISECVVGQLIRYGHYDGTIVKVIDDPFSPKILARFPEHEHPLMREVLLIVEKNAGT